MLEPADAIDAYLITGGFPEIVQSWEAGWSRSDFLQHSLTNPLSPLLASGELILLSEFPESTATRAVLDVIGAGEQTFSAIANKASAGQPLASGTLASILTNLVAKRVISVDIPLSAKSESRNKRYKVDDPYLRFWLTFLRRGVADVERGRGDLVGADQRPANTIHFVGSIKWWDTKLFDQRECETLASAVTYLPGATAHTPMVGVSRAGFTRRCDLAARWGPADLIAAWA